MRSGLILAYICAGGGAIVRMLQANSSPERLMAIALLLFTADLARMALVDLNNFNSVRMQLDSHPNGASAIASFGYSLAVTIVLELLGLVVSWRWVGVGIAIVMLSQLVFNLSVTISISPINSVSPINSEHSPPRPTVRPWPLMERLDVLLADAVALGLAVLWMLADRPLAIAISLLAMVTIYLAIKYVPLFLTAFRR